MPLATPQGTLDFKSVDTITFVGASSNTVIDTTTGSFGVGVDANGPTSNLHVVGDALITGNVADLNIVSNVNMLHTSNTASIKLNSNVVTEFPRSKKLMKFPRVAMTADNQPTGYVASASSSATSPYNAFDNILYTSYWEPNYSTTAYPNADGAYTGGTGTVYSTNGYTGEYLQIQLPVKIKLYEYSLSNRTNSALGGRQPKNAKIFASNDGSTWHDIHTHSDNAGTYHVTNGETRSFQLDNITETYYKYYRLAVNSIIEGGVNDSPNISDWSLYGTPEYDPEAHGVDVTVKSVPNVPNTDWLEVYYDAKDYTSGVVPDLSTNSLNGTLTNGATFDNSDGIGKFTFDGSNDYISGSIPSTFTGNQTYTFSTWIKPTSHPSSGFIGIFEAGTRSTDDSFGLYLNAGNIVHLAYGTNLATTTLAPVGQWTHITGTYTSGDRKVYANGVLLGQDTYSALTLAGTTLVVGANSGGTQPFTGSIANFRIFNRALTTDEIYQLYAYQKEYFGHGVLGMTLKAGRLGIGTSEPRAALDVRGDIHGGCPAFFNAYRDAGNTSGAVNPIIWNQVTINKGEGYDNVTGKFTASLSGYYRFDVYFSIENTGSAGDIALQWVKNDTDRTQKIYGWANVANHTNVAGNITIYLSSGDTFHIRQISGRMSSDSANDAQVNTNGYSGFYLSS
jgi:hypothetical protein